MAPTAGGLVSIITPSLNQATFLEQALISVWGQDYPNVEHIVVDGGSDDDSVKLLREFEEKYRLRWVSEPDRGQSHALNKAVEMSRGEVIGWLNADDTYLPGAISRAVGALMENPTAGWAYGKGYTTNRDGRVLRKLEPGSIGLRDLVVHGMIAVQPTLFFMRSTFDQTSGFDERIETAMDEAIALQMALGAEPVYVDRFQATRRVHEGAKSVRISTRFCDDSILALETFYARQKVPQPIRQIKGLAYSNRYGICAKRMFRSNDYFAAQAWIRKALCARFNPFEREFWVLIILLVQAILRVSFLSPGRARRRDIADFKSRFGDVWLAWFRSASPEFVCKPEGFSWEHGRMRRRNGNELVQANS